MVRKFTSIAFAGVLSMAAVPAFAQDLGGAINGLTAVPGQLVGGMGQGLGIDLDPFHIFTPAAAPMAPQPAMAPEPMMHRHRMMHHGMSHRHMMMHHKKMMMHHKSKMMMHKKMMKKDSMKSGGEMKGDDSKK